MPDCPINDALRRLIERTGPVETESLPLSALPQAFGRVLAAPIALDRDSPACDVSAMDGFAARAAEISAGPLPIAGEARIGVEPTPLAPGSAVRIFTGSPLPPGADAVIRIEKTDADEASVRLRADASVAPGNDIRRQGENAARGDTVLEAGSRLTPAAVTAVASIGPPTVSLFRRLRIAVITTGDELERAGATPPEADPLPAWRLRDSNGPSLAAMYARVPWIEAVDRGHAADSMAALTERIAEAIEAADAVVLTGGVSKGLYDLVPAAVERAGGEQLFHRLPVRPGRPTFGAIAGEVPVLGLPGNPLSVLSTARRLLAPVLRRRAGFAEPLEPSPRVELRAWTGKSIDLLWWRPVRLIGAGAAELVALRGSGDTCGPATSDGFVEIEPGGAGEGPLPFYGWTPA